MKINKELLKGSSEILVLSVLKAEDLYGYEISKRIQQLSKELFAMGEGTLYPVLHRMEQSKLLQAYWQEIGGRKRKYYSLTRQGRKLLAEKTSEWLSFSSAVKQVIG